MMAQLAIKGHETRGKEVIALLEMLGGKNESLIPYDGRDSDSSYRITDDGCIVSSRFCPNKKGVKYQTYTLEVFEKEFSYKVGDEVVCEMPGFGVCKIVCMIWSAENDEVSYLVQRKTESELYSMYVCVQDLRPYNPEPVESSPDKAKAPSLEGQDYSEGRCSYKIPEGFEFDKVENGEIILKPKGLPKSYKKCFKILYGNYHHVVYVAGLDGLGNAKDLFESFIKLKICRDSYWKLAGNWEPVHQSDKDNTFYTIHRFNNEIIKSKTSHRHSLLEFPNEEMRDTFYENFKDLINECKELL